MTTTIRFVQDKPESLDSPVYITEGETRYFACSFWDTPSSVTVTTYRSTTGTGNGVAVTGIFAAGSPTITGYTAALTAASAFTGKAEYLVNVTATVASEVFVKYFRIRVRKDESLNA